MPAVLHLDDIRSEFRARRLAAELEQRQAAEATRQQREQRIDPT
ncbi:hypothetical protein [Pseudaquabacterium rugosum]|uniref:Uncharacterized protein n=1 Tax=Pseudaquabacterium rugosum TaxID=2984194 RepID=A0ABU9BBR0_9BURK